MVTNQGYKMDRGFCQIYNYCISIIFLSSITLEVMKVEWKRVFCDLYAWLMDNYSEIISIADFDEYALEAQCK